MRPIHVHIIYMCVMLMSYTSYVPSKLDLKKNLDQYLKIILEGIPPAPSQYCLLQLNG